MLNKTKKRSFAWRHPRICTLINHGQRPITARVAFTSLYKRPFVCKMLKYGMHKFNLSYDKRATQTAFCFTTPLPNELRAILRVLLSTNQASLAKISQRTQTYFRSTHGEKRQLKIRLRSLASKKSVCLKVTKRCWNSKASLPFRV